MSKAILLKYKHRRTHFFGDSWEEKYDLTLLKTTFFGRKKEITINYTLSMFHDLKTFHEHWDDLIETKKPIKL
jgi:hypothetical protein